ncbi:MAG TPA: hypothetical protein VMR50_18210 [Myxococcota bacterium]|nr:hypothetical protein [Myxococcota bacterium]
MLLRGIALLAIVLAAGAPLARAGGTIGPPFSELPCRDPQDVLGELEDPNGLYVMAANCPAECRRAERDCEQYAKLATSCRLSALGDFDTYQRQSCLLQPRGPVRTDCLRNFAGFFQSARALEKDHLATAVQGCQSWGAECQSACPP